MNCPYRGVGWPILLIVHYKYQLRTGTSSSDQLIGNEAGFFYLIQLLTIFSSQPAPSLRSV